jgi:HEPN domain-containing protein
MKDKTKAIAWLERARKNLEYAKCGNGNEAIAFEDRCNQCSQAGEKAFKSVLVLKHGENYIPPKGTKGHQLDHLIKKLEEKGVTVPDNIKDAAMQPYYQGGFSFPLTSPFNFGFQVTLNDNAVLTKYPSNLPSFTKEAFINAFEKAHAIVKWAESLVNETH